MSLPEGEEKPNLTVIKGGKVDSKEVTLREPIPENRREIFIERITRVLRRKPQLPPPKLVK